MAKCKVKTRTKVKSHYKLKLTCVEFDALREFIGMLSFSTINRIADSNSTGWKEEKTHALISIHDAMSDCDDEDEN